MSKKKMLFTLGTLLLTIEILGLAYHPAFGAQNVISFSAFPISDASVHASNNNGEGSQTDYTNSTGGYFMNTSLIEPGIYTVEASANGYLKGEMNTTINALTDVKTINIILNRSAIIEGRITGTDGSPVAGVYVMLYQVGSLSWIDETQTDSNGMYYFATDVETGTYYVKTSFYFPTLVFPWYLDNPYLHNGYVEGTSGNITATQGLLTVASDLVLDNSGIITGTVKDNQGHPLPNATLSMFGGFPNFYYMTVKADSNGVYRISYNVVDGNYTLTSAAEGFIGGEVEVTATQTGTVTQDLTMFKSATVSGHVLRTGDLRPIPSVVITMVDDSFTYFESGSTNMSGVYAITDGLGPGNYTVTAHLGSETVNMTTITLAAGQNMTLDFTAEAYFISGTVYANATGGTPLMYPDIDLTFSDTLPAGGNAFGEIDGIYLLPLAITPGTGGNSYSANFTVSAYGYNTTSFTEDITVGTDLSNKDFALPKSPPYVPPPPPPSATITGTIYGNSGPDLPFSYEWWHMSDSGYQFMVGFNTSSHIDFAFENLLAKTIDVSVWGPEGSTGQMTVWIPTAIFQGPFAVSSMPGPNPTVHNEFNNGTHEIIQISYSHSSKYIYFTSSSAVPEFQGPLALIAMMFAIAAAVYLQKKWILQPKPQTSVSP